MEMEYGLLIVFCSLKYNSTLRATLARKWGLMLNVTGLPDVSAQFRAFLNGRSNTSHGDLYTQAEGAEWEKTDGKEE